MFKAIAIFVSAVLISAGGATVVSAGAEAGKSCEPLETQPIKVEGWISKKFKKDQNAIAREFASLGNTRTDLRVFPMGDTAQVVAIGRCVPAPIARHVLASALKYTGGVSYVINQDFVAPHWIGIGTTIFDEPSQQAVTEDQVKQLLNNDLSTEEFQALYKKFSVQNENSARWGQAVPNIKRPDKIHETAAPAK